MRALLALVLLVVSQWSWHVVAEETRRQVIASGYSTISESDAVRAAQRAAVEQGIGVFIRTESQMSNFELVRDDVLSTSQGYVTSSDIVESKAEGGEFRVKIRAMVSLEQIKNDLMAMDILLDAMARPKLLILIDESGLDASMGDNRLAEAALNRVFLEKGFDLVDANQLEALSAQEQERQRLLADENAARSIALTSGAQYLIMGKATAENAGEAFPGSGIQSIQVNISARVIQAQTGRMLGSVIERGVSAHISALSGATKAFEQAALAAADNYLVNAITEAFQDALNNGLAIKLKIQNVDQFRTYKSVEKALLAMSTLPKLKSEGWNRVGKLLQLEVQFKGTSDDLATVLDGLAIADLGELMVVDLAPDQVVAELQMKAKPAVVSNSISGPKTEATRRVQTALVGNQRAAGGSRSYDPNDRQMDYEDSDDIRQSTYHALLIGVSQYEHGSISDLDQPESDAEQLAAILKENYTFDQENITVLKSPRRGEILDALDRLTQQMSENDNLVIFYAGHGYWDAQTQQGYWLPADAQQDRRRDWIPNGTIVDYINGIGSRHTLLISDACFSGGIFKTRSAFNEMSTALDRLYRMPSRKAMTSGTMTEVPDKSTFLEYFTKKLVTNDAAFLSSEQLFASFRTAVINNSPTNQVPQFGEIRQAGDEGGDFIFVRRQ
jgi:hypothetical protein